MHTRIWQHVPADTPAWPWSACKRFWSIFGMRKIIIWKRGWFCINVHASDKDCMGEFGDTVWAPHILYLHAYISYGACNLWLYFLVIAAAAALYVTDRAGVQPISRKLSRGHGRKSPHPHTIIIIIILIPVLIFIAFGIVQISKAINWAAN